MQRPDTTEPFAFAEAAFAALEGAEEIISRTDPDHRPQKRFVLSIAEGVVIALLDIARELRMTRRERGKGKR